GIHRHDGAVGDQRADRQPRAVEGHAGCHDGGDGRRRLHRAAHRQAGARRLRRDEEVALPRGLARSGRLRHPARAPRFHGEHRDVRGRDPGSPRRDREREPAADHARARPHGGVGGHPDAARRAGRVDRARIRAGELLDDQRNHRARASGAAPRRHLCVAHAERGDPDRPGAERAVPRRAEADIPAEVSHLKVSGRDSWGQMRRVIARIDSARASGLDVTADQYPYIRAATALDASIPTWAESGGMDSLLARLRDPRTRARLRQEMLHPRGGAESFYYEAGGGAGVLITGTFQDSLRGLQGKTIAEIAAARHRDAVETLFDIVLAEGGHRTDAVYAVMSEPDVQEAMKTWWVAVNTDFGGVAPDGPLGSQSAHPRAYGTFARILGHYVRELKLFPLEFAVRKMTSLAAQRVGLGDRG